MEKVLKSEVVFEGRFLNVVRDTIQLPNGLQGIREYILHPGASVILVQNEKKEFLLLKQYRHPLKNYFYEFPAGKRDSTEEDFLKTAQRELHEETGYLAKTWRCLGPVHPCIGYANEVIQVYWACGLELRAHNREEGEHIEMEWQSSSAIHQLIKNNLMTDAKSLSVWMLAIVNNLL